MSVSSPKRSVRVTVYLAFSSVIRPDHFFSGCSVLVKGDSKRQSRLLHDHAYHGNFELLALDLEMSPLLLIQGISIVVPAGRFRLPLRSRQLNAVRRGIAGTFWFIVLTDPWVIP